MLSTFPWFDAVPFHSKKEKEVIVFLEPTENHFLFVFVFFFFSMEEKGGKEGGIAFMQYYTNAP